MRSVIHVGSDAGGAKCLYTITYNSEGKATCSAIESTAEKAQEKKRMKKEAQDDNQHQDSQND